MAVKLAPAADARVQCFDDQGNVLAGGKLFSYAAGSSTKQNTYTSSTGLVANANPIVLDADGRTPNGIWFTTGLSYKLVLASSTDSDPPTSPLWSEDNLTGIGDATAVNDQWVASGLTPTYISATQFSLAGDQTTEFHVGRRLKTTNSGGTIYSRITASAFTTLTTITVVNDSGTLDSGLSAVSYGLLSATNPSIPKASVTLDDVTVDNIFVAASGRAIVGHTAAVAALGVTPAVQNIGTSAGTSSGINACYSADSVGPSVILAKSRNASAGSHTVVQSGDSLGTLSFTGSDGDEFLAGARITSEVDGTPGNGDMPGRLVFLTTADGASSPTEALRIDSSQRVYTGGTIVNVGALSTPSVQINSNTTGTGVLLSSFSSSAATRAKVHFVRSRNATIGSHTVVQDGDEVGSLVFDASDGDTFEPAATITVEVDGTPGDGDMPGRIVMSTTPNGSASIVEAFRLDNAGEAYFPVAGTTGTAANAFLDTGSSPANQLLVSTSSLRYKTNVEDVEKSCVDAVLKLRPIWYRSLARHDNPEWSFYGLGAEEVAQIDPRLVIWGRPVISDQIEDVTVTEQREVVSVVTEMIDGVPVFVKKTVIEDVQVTKKKRVVKRSDTLQPDGVMYDRVAVLLLAKVKELVAEVGALKAKVG